ncbi:PREDICTED: putative lipid-binding protein AIR1 [Tarenaya hassleriana]|uniref:putative lipid-binding protein AIR1 n=1 Tax=Tarenaya hassleriana TaxID=28532 RepID=UPI00053C7010|nr:PREDICTED: putative lipid-binding protein AIR1 [Tarenaya hassleriana]
MASKSTTRMILVLAFNILLFDHFAKTAHGVVSISICPRSILQITSCAPELITAVTSIVNGANANIGINNGGIGVGVGVPVPAPSLTNCCSLISGLTESQTNACVNASVTASLLGILLPNVDFASLVRNVCARLQ